MPAFPGDLHHLLRAIDVDRDGKRFRVFQWTLVTASWRNDWIDVRAATCEAISTNAFAPADSGREMTTGTPLSASSRIDSSSGIAPRNGTPSLLAADSAPPWLKISCRWPQLGHTYQLMFSMRPSGVTLSLRNICSALTAMSVATSCGVHTMATPVSGTAWASVSDASPVPGGRSMTR